MKLSTYLMFDGHCREAFTHYQSVLGGKLTAMMDHRGTPAEAQAGFIDWSQKIANSPETKTAWANNGAEYPNVTGAQFGAFIAAEIKRWAQVVKASGAKLD